MFNQNMTDIHRQFLNDCMNMKLYRGYVHRKVCCSSSFSESELDQYHTAYVKLVSSFEGFSESQLRINIANLLDSTKSADEKYNEYKQQIKESVELYNAHNALHLHKQIKFVEKINNTSKEKK